MIRKKFFKLLREQREVQVLASLVVLLIIVFLGIIPDIKNSNFYSLFGVLSFFSLLIFSVIYVLETIITVMKESTYTFLLIVILFPLVMVPFQFIKQWDINAVNTFLTVAIGIGINYAIDGVLGIVDGEILDFQRKLLTKKSSITKIFFNTLYISECLMFSVVKEGSIVKYFANFDGFIKDNEQYVFLISALLTWVIMVALSLVVVYAVKRELNSESIRKPSRFPKRRIRQRRPSYKVICKSKQKSLLDFFHR